MTFRPRRMTVERFGLSEKGVEIENMSKLHKFKVEHEVGAYHPWQAKCFIDDKNVKIRGYTLEHYVDDVPRLNIDMQVDAPDIENVEAEIKIANKEEIAALMDREEFEEFCKIWEKIHG